MAEETRCQVNDNPIYSLAQKVLKNELTLATALERVATKSILAQVDNVRINKLNRCAYNWGRRDPPQATVLAVLNCRAARLKGSDAMRGDCNSTLGWLYLKQDKLDQALDCYQKALKFLQPIARGRAAVARVRLEMGDVWMRQGNLAAAIAEYKAVLSLARELERPRLESDAKKNLGAVYLAQGKVDAALTTFGEALKISRESQDQYGETAALGELGRTNRFIGRLNEAIGYHQQALDISRTLDHLAGTGRHLGQLGSALLEKGELDEAEARFLEAVKIARQRHDRSSEQQRLGSLGNLCQARARRESNQWLAMAQRHLERALAIAREQGDRRSQAHHLLNLGNVHRRLARFKQAQQCFAEALSLAEEQRAWDTQWRIQYAWGSLWDTCRQDERAYNHYASAIKIVEEQRSQLKLESRTKFWQERAILYKRMVLCCLRLGQLWPALEYTERAKARYLADLMAERAPGTSNASSIQTTLAALPHSAVVVFNVTEIGAVVFIVAARPGKSGASSPDNDWQQSPAGRIRARLFEGLNQDVLQRILVQVDDTGKASGGYLVDYYFDHDSWAASIEKACKEIYDTLLAHVHRELARLGVQRVVFMPNLGLSLLPLHACQTEQGYLLDHYEITYAPSFSVLGRCQEKQPGDDSLFAVSNPTGDLVWAEVEVERIADLFPKDQVRVLDNGAKDPATQKAVIAGAPDYAFVHFACHGEFNLLEPSQSALKLAPPESLTLDMALKDLELPRARLVVMSACETGLVDPGDLADEYVSLPAGFLLAGAPTVLASLWAVDDLSTALLMERFYFYHLKGDPERLSLAQALRRAQQWLRDEVTAAMAAEVCFQRVQALRAQGGPLFELAQSDFFRYDRMLPASRPFAHPLFWAPFTLAGQ